MRRRPTAVLPALPLMWLLLAANGCSVFEPVGDFISQEYENTVSYFNAYYNAERVFDDAEASVLALQLMNRGKSQQTGQASQIPQDLRQKFTTVIDKCSNILSFHPRSAYVDAALFMIGRSYFYQGEYLKAERKFSELINRYPESSYLPQAQWWFARSLRLEKKLDEALLAADTAMASARLAGDEDLESRSMMIKGSIFRERKDFNDAIAEYSEAVATAEDSKLRNSAGTTLGDIYEDEGQYAKADSAYQLAESYTDDIYETYYDRFRSGLAEEKAGNDSLALDYFDRLEHDFRMKDYLGSIRLERARTLDEIGRTAEAMDELRIVDTTYVKTDVGQQASFELASIYESEAGDYRNAVKYYARAAAVPGNPLATEATYHAASLNRYFDSRVSLTRLDSLLEALALGTSGSLDSARADSTKRDTLHAKPSRVRWNIDSLKTARSLAAQELADVFYAELNYPDSAVIWYREAIRIPDSARSPRIMYILAEIARTHPDKPFEKPEELYHRIVKEYPTSVYASEARRLLGLEQLQGHVDPAESLYAHAAALAESSQCEGSKGEFERVTAEYPKSPYAARSQFAVAWLYEHCFGKPDSALAQYRRVVLNYGSTKYAVAARAAIGEQPVVAPADSARREITPPHPMTRGTAAPDSLMKPQAPPPPDDKSVKRAN